MITKERLQWMKERPGQSLEFTFPNLLDHVKVSMSGEVYLKNPEPIVPPQKTLDVDYVEVKEDQPKKLNL